MSFKRLNVTSGTLKGTAAFGAAVVVNVALFSSVMGLNRVIDVDVTKRDDITASFMVQDLPPPQPIKAPPKEVPPKPKPETAEAAPMSDQQAPTPLPSLDMGLASASGLGVMVSTRPTVGGGPPIAAPVRPASNRVYRRGEVDRAVHPLTCSTVSRPPAIVRRRGLAGSVRVRAVVDPGGTVRSPRAVAMTGDRHPAFSEEAVRHLKTCRFNPAHKDGRAVSQWVERVYEFANRG